MSRKVRYKHQARFAPEPVIHLTADGAIPLGSDETYLLAKTSAGAWSVAAPGAKNVGRRLTLMGGTNFVHVVTFTGATLREGTGVSNTTFTTTAFAGCVLCVRAISPTVWCVESHHEGTVA